MSFVKYIMNKEDNKNQVDKLIEFFKTLQQQKPRPGPADYSSWDQTEEAYQEEQARWMAKLNQKKQKDKKNKKNG